MVNEAAASTTSETSLTAVTNPPDPLAGTGLVRRYTRDGSEVLIPGTDAARLEVELNLLPVKYDLEHAIAEWHALFDAKRDAVLRSLEEMTTLGYERDETGWILSTAHSNERAAFEHLLFAIGALLPTESTVRDTAAHKAEHGSLAAVPAYQKYEALADAYQPKEPQS